ncbi:MAG: PEP-CTERM sorting domain-containing protein [Phycisphaerae bacterium]|nr:PEP-CTERM sorting domain-containing protein [Phycisphaerae bacterium]
MNTKIQKNSKCFLTAVAAVALAVSFTSEASATQYDWEWTAAESLRTNDWTHEAGYIESVGGWYDDVTHQLKWEVHFDLTQDDNGAGDGRTPDGFFLVVNSGGVPTSSGDNLAAYYFDRNGDGTDPRLSVYRYDGGRDRTWETGELLLSTEDAISDDSWVNHLSVETTKVDGVYTARWMTMDINVGELLDMGVNTGWDEEIGVWFHPVDNTSIAYNADGSLGDFWFDFRGSFDINNDVTTTTNVIPEPASFGLLGLGSLALMRRRRKTA